MSLRRAAWVAGCLILAAGCAQRPVPIAQPLVFQETLTGAAHWRLLAKDTADLIDDCLAGRTRQDYLRGIERLICPHPVPGIESRPLFVEQADSAMPFGRAFHGYLTDALVSRGRLVSFTPEGANLVRYRMEILGRTGKLPLPGDFTVLGAGLWSLRNSDSAGRMFITGAIADVYYNLYFKDGDYDLAQVVFTTSLMAGDRLVMQRTDGFYVPAADLAHYASLAPRADLVPPLPAKGTPPSVRAFNVVGE
jgi:hypothetical protein